MNIIEAALDLVREGQAEKMSYQTYRRVRRALKALGFNNEDAITVLVGLDYYSPRTREPYPWLQNRIDARTQKAA